MPTVLIMDGHTAGLQVSVETYPSPSFPFCPFGPRGWEKRTIRMNVTGGGVHFLFCATRPLARYLQVRFFSQHGGQP